MSNRNFIFGLFICLILIVSLGCGNGDQPDSHAAVTKNQPTVAQAESTGDELNTLSPAELPDDSVFSDGSRPTSWKNAGITDSLSVKLFIKKLKRWVEDNQVDSISAYLQYPLRNPGIKDAKDFKLNYGDYFSDGVKAAIAGQRLTQIFRNEQGAMIGQGQVWLREQDHQIKIIAINN